MNFTVARATAPECDRPEKRFSAYKICQCRTWCGTPRFRFSPDRSPACLGSSARGVRRPPESSQASPSATFFMAATCASMENRCATGRHAMRSSTASSMSPKTARAMVYGMARPSFRRHRVAGGSGGGMGMDIAVLGVDLGKNVCSVVGLDTSGAVVMRRKVRRETLIALAENLPACVVGMEACCGAHHVGRVFTAHGHDVRLMSPEYVRPYVKAQKNDDRDAEGIAEAATRPTMRFVELKSQDQLDMQTLHRSRDRLVGERTALINQLRAILLERGYVAPQGKRKLEQFLSVLMDEQGGADLSPRIALLVADARAQWAELDRRISAFDTEFVHWVKENEEARRLTTIPGIGAIVASALVAAIGQAESFDRGRDLAAWLGLVPRQFTTGGKPKLLGISKRGNKYLRRQLIHGARAALPYVAERDTPLGRWAKGLLSRAHHNVAVVAYANKLARIAWAVLRRGERFAATGTPMAA